jgi:hypothetical protein
MVDFKSILKKEAGKALKKEAEKAILKKAAGKILPMDGEKPKMGWKVKLAGILATIATVAAAASQYLSS